ncbi:MAG: DUF58 domain-containing protein [Cellvibrionaceae bacterium]
MKIPIINSFRLRMWNWIDSRRPTSNLHHLTRNNLFIFPSQQGVWFLLANLLLWVLGTNYQNNLILALAFLLMTFFVIAILHTFTNLSGMSVNVLGADPVFCGDAAEIKVALSSRQQRFRDFLSFKWQGCDPIVCHLESDDEIVINTFVKTHHRGLEHPGKLIVETFYPLGIIRSWTRLKTKLNVLVYPKPISFGPLPLSKALSDEGVVAAGKGGDEFSGYKNYQAGDSLKDVSWKTYARGMGVYSKEYSAYRDQRLWLDWDYLDGKKTEERLSGLCSWALEAHQADKDFGLRIPGVEIQPSSGKKHLERVLKALALFGVDSSSDMSSLDQAAGES